MQTTNFDHVVYSCSCVSSSSSRSLYNFQIMIVEALNFSLVHIVVRRWICKLFNLIDSYASWTLNVFWIVSSSIQMWKFMLQYLILNIFIIFFISVHCSSYSSHQTLNMLTSALIESCISLSVWNNLNFFLLIFWCEH